LCWSELRRPGGQERGHGEGRRGDLWVEVEGGREMAGPRAASEENSAGLLAKTVMQVLDDLVQS
jgi:hypothetical protein